LHQKRLHAKPKQLRNKVVLRKQNTNGREENAKEDVKRII